MLSGVPESELRNKEGFIYIYDVTSKYQISKMLEWVQKIDEYSNIENSVILVLGNKIDESP